MDDILLILYAISDVISILSYVVLAYLFFDYLKPRHATILRVILNMFAVVFLFSAARNVVHLASLVLDIPFVMLVVVSLTGSVASLILLLLTLPMVPTIMKFPNASAMSKANYEMRSEISDLLERNAKLATVDNIKAVANITEAICAVRSLAQGGHSAKERAE